MNAGKNVGRHVISNYKSSNIAACTKEGLRRNKAASTAESIKFEGQNSRVNGVINQRKIGVLRGGKAAIVARHHSRLSAAGL